MILASKVCVDNTYMILDFSAASNLVVSLSEKDKKEGLGLAVSSS
jgi:hypothetical protein